MSPLTEGIRQVSKSPGLQRLPDLINAGKVDTVIVAKLDRLTRSVKDLCGLLELFEKRKVALVSVAESLDTGSAAWRRVITIMAAVSQREREAIGERTRDALRPKRGKGERVGNIEVWLPAGRRRRTRRARSGRAGGTGNRTTGSLRRS
jgi:site-specific DNA recombinase